MPCATESSWSHGNAAGYQYGSSVLPMSPPPGLEAVQPIWNATDFVKEAPITQPTAVEAEMESIDNDLHAVCKTSVSFSHWENRRRRTRTMNSATEDLLRAHIENEAVEEEPIPYTEAEIRQRAAVELEHWRQVMTMRQTCGNGMWLELENFTLWPVPKPIPKKRNSGARDLKVQFASTKDENGILVVETEVQYIEECKKSSDPVAWFWWAVETEDEARQFPFKKYNVQFKCWIVSESDPQSPALPGWPLSQYASDGSWAAAEPSPQPAPVTFPSIDKVSFFENDTNHEERGVNHHDRPRLEAPDSRWCDVVMERLQSEKASSRCAGLSFLLCDDAEGCDAQHPDVGCKNGDVVLPLALSSHGHQVITQALAVASKADQSEILSALTGHVQELIASPYGHEVLQSCVECAVPSAVLFIATELAGSACAIARVTEKYQLICRLLEHLPTKAMESLVEELLAEIPALCRHPRGNHVIQHLLEYGSQATQLRVCSFVASDLLNLSKHRIASHVVEKAVDASDPAATALVAQAALSQSSTLLALACNRQSQFVAQRLARHGGEEGHQVRCVLHANMQQLKASKYGSRLAESLATLIDHRLGATAGA